MAARRGSKKSIANAAVATNSPVLVTEAEADLFAAPAPIDTPVAERATALYNGTYTITSPSGEHRTFKIKTVQGGALEGKRIVELLTGPDNEADYTGFGFVNDDGTATGVGIKVWNRFAAEGFHTKAAKMLVVMGLTGEDNDYGRAGCRILLARRCSKCNRKLTDPTSIKLGIGPICRAGGEDLG